MEVWERLEAEVVRIAVSGCSSPSSSSLSFSFLSSSSISSPEGVRVLGGERRDGVGSERDGETGLLDPAWAELQEVTGEDFFPSVVGTWAEVEGGSAWPDGREDDSDVGVDGMWSVGRGMEYGLGVAYFSLLTSTSAMSDDSAVEDEAVIALPVEEIDVEGVNWSPFCAPLLRGATGMKGGSGSLPDAVGGGEDDGETLVLVGWWEVGAYEVRREGMVMMTVAQSVG
jgi:hypothetical protein